MLETILLALIAILPSLAAVGTVVAAVSKFLKSIAELKTSIQDTKEFDLVKNQVKLLQQENLELKNMLKELLIAFRKFVPEENAQ